MSSDRRDPPHELNPYPISHRAIDYRLLSQGNDYSSIIGLGDKSNVYHNILTGRVMCNGNGVNWKDVEIEVEFYR